MTEAPDQFQATFEDHTWLIQCHITHDSDEVSQPLPLIEVVLASAGAHRSPSSFAHHFPSPVATSRSPASCSTESLEASAISSKREYGKQGGLRVCTQFAAISSSGAARETRLDQRLASQSCRKRFGSSSVLRAQPIKSQRKLGVSWPAEAISRRREYAPARSPFWAKSQASFFGLVLATSGSGSDGSETVRGSDLIISTRSTVSSSEGMSRNCFALESSLIRLSNDAELLGMMFRLETLDEFCIRPFQILVSSGMFNAKEAEWVGGPLLGVVG